MLKYAPVVMSVRQAIWQVTVFKTLLKDGWECPRPAAMCVECDLKASTSLLNNWRDRNVETISVMECE